MDGRVVAGEPVGVLLEAFLRIKWRENAGMVEISAKLESELGEPLLRALERIEQELFANDLDNGLPSAFHDPVPPRHLFMESCE